MFRPPPASRVHTTRPQQGLLVSLWFRQHESRLDAQMIHQDSGGHEHAVTVVVIVGHNQVNDGMVMFARFDPFVVHGTHGATVLLQNVGHGTASLLTVA